MSFMGFLDIWSLSFILEFMELWKLLILNIELYATYIYIILDELPSGKIVSVGGGDWGVGSDGWGIGVFQSFGQLLCRDSI